MSQNLESALQKFYEQKEEERAEAREKARRWRHLQNQKNEPRRVYNWLIGPKVSG